MKKIIILMIIVATFYGCSNKKTENKSESNKTENKISLSPEISVIDAKKANDNNSHILIDVREQSEYDEVHIENIKLISLGDLNKSLDQLDKSKKYITVCRSGGRSESARKLMSESGFQVQSMAGGMMKWQENNLPIKK